ncbi:RcnB family protein [Zavarzinia compransoris]|uniref:RcnB family protein n=1 Tax=Zavarzinia compransoris TaxID=1264899 RepID=A0A317E033_9PROT|nr:RcnB family protein [Zavarzinia compransoris]PWR18713.1 hypothetical protein DKG75_17125 [Zavarzinia compransoris]TDP48692.1 nickel/cobalt transporter regulator [Zavarzinia compransoris]
MKGLSRRALVLFLAVLGPGAALAAQPSAEPASPRRDPPRRDTGRAAPGRPSAPRPAAGHDPIRLDDRQRDALRHWQDRHPGWQRPVPGEVARGVAVHAGLPPGHYRPPPSGLVDLLPRPPAGHAYFAVGGDVVLAVIATGIIVQIVLAGS